ncbi:PAS domain-containing protein [Methylobacterium sp. A54F]
MGKLKNGIDRASQVTLQAALDSGDVAGNWEWDIRSDRVNADALVALLFNVDPEHAEAGAPRAAFTAGIHPHDRQRVSDLIGACAREGSVYVTQYRVCSADGVDRWLLSRGRFLRDAEGLPVRGRGIVVDITESRTGEDASGAEEAATPLEHVADRAIAAHKAITVLNDPQLQLLSDALLLEVGRQLARREASERRRRMN